MSRTLVSVCMITYKHESFIKQAIEGVLMQECDFDVELIIADDNSPDNTKTIVESFKSNPNYSWIKYIRHDLNKGMMGNFYWVLTEAKGKYIALCEGDDYWTDSLKLKRQVNFLDTNSDYSIICHDAVKLIESDRSLIRMNKSFEGYFSIETFLESRVTIPTASILFKKIKVIPSWINKCSVGDWPIILWLLTQGKGYFINEQMCIYRKHEGGVSRSINNSNHSKILLNTFLEINRNINNVAIKHFISSLAINSVSYELRKSKKFVIKEFYLSLFFNPSQISSNIKILIKTLIKVFIKL